MSEEKPIEEQLLEEEEVKEQIKKGQEYLKARKAARAHFHRLRLRNGLLNKDSTVDTTEEMNKEVGIDNGGE